MKYFSCVRAGWQKVLKVLQLKYEGPTHYSMIKYIEWSVHFFPFSGNKKWVHYKIFVLLFNYFINHNSNYKC